MSYIGSFQPYSSDPIPVIDQSRILFTEPFIKASFRETAIIDTGADVSNIPARLINHHNLPDRDWEDFRYPNGPIRSCPIFLLRVEVNGLRTMVVERFGDYGFDELILGRNLLNRWRIVLDPSHRRGLLEIEIED